MNLVHPSPWGCVDCKKRAKLYADGVIWCEHCGNAIPPHEAVNVARGRQTNRPSPAFKPLKVD